MHHSDDKDKHNNRNQEKISKEINKKPDDSPDFHISSNYSTDKKGEEREEREKGEEKSKHSKKGEKREKGKKKKREGVPRIPARNPLSQEGGDLLSRIAVQYHRRARA